jgi:DNA-binding NtrC family response regulator
LIADNEFLIRWSLEQALIQDGHQVVTVEDGQKAIETGRTDFFDFVITDLFMPELDGWQVLDFFSRVQAPSRVIVMTAHGESESARLARERGACAYVEKPYVIDKIRDILRATSLSRPL